jgi:hypothetical protein
LPAFAKTIAAVFLVTGALLLLPRAMQAQDNYEIQVYGSDTVERGVTMVEIHSNFTIDGSLAAPGSDYTADGTVPTNHAMHETLEITRGITPWFETGFYVFSSIQPNLGWQWVGDHIRPRVRAPDSWHWPVGASLSVEVGYQQARYSPDTWSLELRPIIDKRVGRWYWSFNPTFDRALHGPGVADGWDFAPNAKASYDLVRWKGKGGYPKVLAAGLEYYASYGQLGDVEPFPDQDQQFFPAVDLDVSPNWEFNFGVGFGATQASDHLIVKAIVGRRFNWGGGKKHKNDLGIPASSTK